MTFTQKCNAIEQVKRYLDCAIATLKLAQRQASDSDAKELPTSELEASLQCAINDADATLEALDAEEKS